MCPIFNGCDFPESLQLPLSLKPRQASFTGEELLHGSLFEVALLGY